MNNFDQGWRELNTPEKVETATDFFIVFTGIMLIVGLVILGVLLIHDYYHERILTDEAVMQVVCGQVGPMTIYCNAK